MNRISCCLLTLLIKHSKMIRWMQNSVNLEDMKIERNAWIDVFILNKHWCKWGKLKSKNMKRRIYELRDGDEWHEENDVKTLMFVLLRHVSRTTSHHSTPLSTIPRHATPPHATNEPEHSLKLNSGVVALRFELVGSCLTLRGVELSHQVVPWAQTKQDTTFEV